MKRPLLPVVLLYVGGILAAEFVELPLFPLLALLLCLATDAASVSRFRLILLYALILLSGLANSTLHTAIISPVDIRHIFGDEPHLVTIRGQLIETPTLRLYANGREPSWRTLTRMKVDSVCLAKNPWKPATGCVAITTAVALTNYFSGQIVEVMGVVARPRNAVAEGTFDYRRYLENQGIYYQLRAESQADWRAIDSPASLPLTDRFSAWARQTLARGLPTEDESLRLEWALSLGWKTALTEEVSEPFVRAATYHIFAVDGLRMAILFGIFYCLLRVLNVPRPVSGAVLIPLIWFYVALTGWPASAIRASVMLTIIILGWVLRRPTDPINSLFAAALIILVWEPGQLFQAGFQLSFVVVLCLILMIPPLFDLMNRILAPDPMLPAQLRPRLSPFVAVPARYIGDLLVTSFAAWVGSLPLVAYYFNIITPVSTPANVIAVPLCVLVLVSNLISLLLAAWLPGIAELFNHAGWFTMECIRVSSEWFASWPAAYCYTPAPSLFTSCLCYGLLFGLVSGCLVRPNLRIWKVGSCAIALLVWTCVFLQEAATTQLTILPVSGGTSVYYDAPGSNKDLLIDVGPTNSVQFIAKPFLRAQGVNRLPNLILTHGDIHHVGGVEPLVQIFGPGRIFTSPARFRSPAYRQIVHRLDLTPGRVTPLNFGDTLGDWNVLHPDASDRFSKADDGAIVLKANLKGTRVLLLSDLGTEGQIALLKRDEDLRADIVVAGLPANGEPLSDPLLEAISPRLIIISDSEFPVSERAGPKVHARLGRKRIPTIFTRETGAVTLRFRQNAWKARTMTGIELSSTTAS